MYFLIAEFHADTPLFSARWWLCAHLYTMAERLQYIRNKHISSQAQTKGRNNTYKGKYTTMYKSNIMRSGRINLESDFEIVRRNAVFATQRRELEVCIALINTTIQPTTSLRQAKCGCVVLSFHTQDSSSNIISLIVWLVRKEP